MKLHPNAPKRLRALFRQHHSCHKVAQAAGVNVRYVYELARDGRAPANPAIGRALGVEYEPVKRLPTGDRRLRHIRWWERLTRGQRELAIDFLYHYQGGAPCDSN